MNGDRKREIVPAPELAAAAVSSASAAPQDPSAPCLSPSSCSPDATSPRTKVAQIRRFCKVRKCCEPCEPAYRNSGEVVPIPVLLNLSSYLCSRCWPLPLRHYQRKWGLGITPGPERTSVSPVQYDRRQLRPLLAEGDELAPLVGGARREHRNELVCNLLLALLLRAADGRPLMRLLLPL